MLSELISIVEKSAPLLASALGSPVAGIAVSLIENAFGITQSNPTQLAAAVSADPDAVAKLKALEFQHEDELKTIASTSYGIEVQDRENARAMAAQFKNFMRHLAYLVTAGFFAAIFLLFFPVTTFTSDEKQLLAMLIGMLVSKWQTIIDFFYGSSNH